MTARPEIYVSTDVEADGPCPGVNSMLSFASVAFLADKSIVGTFEVNLELLPNATQDIDTMTWWKGFPDAWAYGRRDPQDPTVAMQKYAAWLKELPGKPVFVAYPMGFDFTFIYWYLMRFAGESPFGFSGVDVKTYAMALLDTSYSSAVKRNLPKSWFDPLPHTHKAIDDAREQGAMFCNMLAANRAAWTARKDGA